MKLEDVAESMVVADNHHNTALRMLGKPIEFRDIIQRVKLDPKGDYSRFKKGDALLMKLSLCGYAVNLSPEHLDVVYGVGESRIVKSFNENPRIGVLYNKLADEIQLRSRYKKGKSKTI